MQSDATVSHPTQQPRSGALVIGARTSRQGTGPFIAAGLAAAGLPITGIVGTSTPSVKQALADLHSNWQLSPAGYTDLERALTELQPLAVAVCSPWQYHAEQLAEVAAAGCHCLVEKPLAWPASDDTVDALIARFEDQGLLLQLVDQWPGSLREFRQLHGELPAPIDQFRMRLSPISLGPDMLTDSAPHFLGMLHALCGPGDCEDVQVVTGTDASGDPGLQLNCRYSHAHGRCRATLVLRTQVRRPRPAWYEINDLRVDREVELPGYRQYLVSAGKRVPLADPMRSITANFAGRLAAGETDAGQNLRIRHRNLQQLARAIG
jgi:predicted dehydrogenase